jgi:hypothetical protein
MLILCDGVDRVANSIQQSTALDIGTWALVLGPTLPGVVGFVAHGPRDVRPMHVRLQRSSSIPMALCFLSVSHSPIANPPWIP